MQLKINVTQANIDAGRPRAAAQCPVALAIAETLKLSPVFTLEEEWETLWGEKGGTLSLGAQRFIVCFDAGIPVEPFVFVTELF